MKAILPLLLVFILATQISAQINDSPESVYKWKNNKKTVFQDGYVVLKSGKRLEGTISLNGYYNGVKEVSYLGDGKEITFPVAALKSYGLNAKTTAVTAKTGIINDSDESLYEWLNGGVVMDKVITNSVKRDGYVITTDGQKIEGILKIQKRDDELWSFQIKNGKDKQKFKKEEIARYGLTVSKDEIEQSNLAKLDLKFYDGSVNTNEQLLGKVGFKKTSFKIEEIILELPSGVRSSYTPSNAKGFEINKEGIAKKYVSVEDYFVPEKFNGTTFQLYRNPNPTTINNFATSLAKTGAELGTSIAASEIAKKDAKKNNYQSNLDSIIGVSSKDQLIELRDQLLKVGGYSSVEQLNNSSGNESLKNNINAIELAISGKEISESEQGIYNKEWVVLNKKTGEKIIIYKSDYKKLIEPLLFGCYNYLSLDKSAQKKHLKWDNLATTISFLDSCY